MRESEQTTVAVAENNFFFPGYNLVECLWEDEFVRVWQAHDQRLLRKVILLALRITGDASGEMAEEFFSEASSVAHIKHENIVRALDTGRSGEYFYFVTEHIIGQKLSERLENGSKIPEKKALNIALDLALALDYLYEQGMVHGRINPANIIVSRTGKALLFGLGLPLQVLYGESYGQYAIASHYIAPELLSSGHSVEHSGDVYALGACLYQMLGGQLLFASAKNQDELLTQVSDWSLTPLRSIVGSLTDATFDLVKHLLVKNKEDRITNSGKLLEILHQHPLLADKFAENNRSQEQADEENGALEI